MGDIWCDVISLFGMIWRDMLYLLTAIVLTPGGSSTVHIYTKTIHRTTNEAELTEENTHNIKIHKHNNKNVCT